MAQCWALAGMESAVMLRAGSGGVGCGMRLGRGGGLGLRVECVSDFNRFKAPNKKKSSSSSKAEEETKKKRAPVRLPGGRQLPTYGKNSSLQKSNPGLGQFKPPQLFGPPVEYDQEDDIASANTIIEQIREGFGSWQERAAGISELQKLGMGMEEIYEKAFVAAPTQTTMVVAAQVFDSLVQVGCPPELLSWFEESTVDVLYALRTLSANQRKLAAEYVKQNKLEVGGAQELARAIKDHERRPQGREGFTPVPGDCLAFSLHRAAGESTNAEERSLFVERGLSVAVSDSAKDRFSEFL